MSFNNPTLLFPRPPFIPRALLGIFLREVLLGARLTF
jgi:hypothetical protein